MQEQTTPYTTPPSTPSKRSRVASAVSRSLRTPPPIPHSMPPSTPGRRPRGASTSSSLPTPSPTPGHQKLPTNTVKASTLHDGCRSPTETPLRLVSATQPGSKSLPPTPPPTSPSPPPTWTFDFGPYEGKAFHEAPWDYIQCLVDQGFMEGEQYEGLAVAYDEYTRSGFADRWSFNFGKHEGKRISQVPRDYIQSLIDKGIPSDRRRGDLRLALIDYLRASPDRDLEDRLLSLRVELPNWLYDALFAGYGAQHIGTLHSFQLDLLTDRVEVAEDMVDSGFHERYPPRPSDTWSFPECSASVRRLREAISHIPNIRNEEDLDARDAPYVELQEIFPVTEKRIWKLTKGHALRLKRCLADVVTDHGQEGMLAGWWEVRDKYSRCISGIMETDDGVFVDDSVSWLELAGNGRVDARKLDGI
ncbi:hypothetical protein V5O48_002981 [Marasmius crinis-equi]|uniref:Uncharacterized protein n=1 Tax=Marasmius crinis-equi TaxID=585013 RepID=A0ABR3FU62_9AGAR